MRIVLAGYNVDSEVLQKAMTARGLDPAEVTPETLSAAYARISRYPESVDKLRRQARRDVARARSSNQAIIFDMGHASVAEHAVFNFDVIDLSRLAIEAVEHFRLCSYTEKSQRYIRLTNDFLLPAEIAEAGLADAFRGLVDLQQRTYHLLYQKLKEYWVAQYPEQAKNKPEYTLLKGMAKEDARYVTPLATLGQLGLTVNARNLELMIRRLAAHPLQEVKAIAAALYEAAHSIAPSLLRYTTPEESSAPSQESTIQRIAQDLRAEEAFHTQPGQRGAVHLVEATKDGDTLLAAGLLHSLAGVSWSDCQARARVMSQEEKAKMIREVLRPLRVHESPSRIFELVSFRFDLVLSASCFAQLKRHRMATLLVQPYNTSLGFTMPESVGQVGLVNEFQQVMTESANLYRQIFEIYPEAAVYTLTQAHRRRVLLQMNARELYHFSRLRQDHHAQWDIRQLADRMLNLARQEVPLTLEMACGKDAFKERQTQVFPPPATTAATAQ